MPISVQNRDDMQASSGLALDAQSNRYDVTAAIVAMRTSLAQIVANTGGVDAVNLETINLAIQAACEAGAADLATLVTIQTAVRALTEEIRNSSAASATDLAALEVINTDIRTAVQVIDNYVGTHDAVAPAQLAIIGGVAETGVPAAVADGDAVRVNYDEYGRHRDAGHDPAVAAESMADVAPAQMQVLIETGWTQLTAPGAETPARDVRDYENHFVTYDIDIGGCTDVDLIIWGSIDGTLWVPLWEDNITSAETLEDGVSLTGVQVTYIRCEFEGEAGDTDATIDFQLTCGN